MQCAENRKHDPSLTPCGSSLSTWHAWKRQWYGGHSNVHGGTMTLQRWRWSTNNISGRFAPFNRLYNKCISCKREKFVLFCFRCCSNWHYRRQQLGRKNETPLCRTYPTSYHAPMHLSMRHLSMEVVSNNRIHNWWRLCWQFPNLGSGWADLRRWTMVNRQMLVFEVAIGSKTMIQSTGKIRPILEVKDHFTVVSVVCEVSFAFPPFLWL